MLVGVYLYNVNIDVIGITFRIPLLIEIYRTIPDQPPVAHTAWHSVRQRCCATPRANIKDSRASIGTMAWSGVYTAYPIASWEIA